MRFFTTTLLVITVVLVLLPAETAAFGAGSIPDFSYLSGKAFRHGDIENILLELVKSVGHADGGGGFLNFASSVLSAASGGSKFSKEDVKRVYFGNWLRDYSQAMDIAGLSKLSADTLVLIVSILGFLTFGFSTEEFEVTADRLGVYLPVEHIDNPKGYAEKEGDARRYHPKLRPPVDPQELEIDDRTGMKNYMATENRGWDTSTAFIRRTFRTCIDHGRRSGGRDGQDLWEAFRLLGQGLHTLEDFTAHSNWCEIALRKLGHEEVFCHVGDNVFIESPNGRCPPIVTGSFGGADFLHSLMGEATDHISQSSVTDLSEKMKSASGNDSSNMSTLKGILKKFRTSRGDGDAQISEAEEMEAKSKVYHFDPDNMFPLDVQQQLLSILKWRDGVYRDVLKKMEMIPGLADLIDNLSNALNAYVYTVIAPYVTPVLIQVTSVLGEGSKEVIESEDQYEVFNNPNASDPTHSLLSKDHFQIILNECAGKVAQVVIANTVNHIVQAWSNNESADGVIDQILEAFHHPYYASGRSQIQNTMLDTMEKWIDGLGSSEAQEVIQALTKESVRAGKNKRKGSDDETSGQSQEYSHASQEYGRGQSSGGGYGSGGRGGGDSYGRGYEPPYDSRGQESGHGRTSGTSYEERNDPYGEGYGRQERRDEDSGYGGGADSIYGRGNESSYGSHSEDSRYGDGGNTGYGRDNEPSHGRTSGYGAHQSHYGESGGEDTGNRRRNDEYISQPRQSGYGGSSGHGQDDERQPYGSNREESRSYAPSYIHPSGQEPAYSSRREEASSYAPSYPQFSEYGSGQARGYGVQEQAGVYAPSYSQPESGGYESRRSEGYRGREESGYGENDPYSGQERGRYGHLGEREDGDQEGDHHNQRRHGREERTEYGSGETFGAERLNLNEYGSEHHRERDNEYQNSY